MYNRNAPLTLNFVALGLLPLSVTLARMRSEQLQALEQFLNQHTTSEYTRSRCQRLLNHLRNS